jgi:hypothetical protein
MQFQYMLGKAVACRFSIALAVAVASLCLLLGTIEIGQGTFGWKGAKAKSGFKRINWRKFAEDLQKYY